MNYLKEVVLNRAISPGLLKLVNFSGGQNWMSYPNCINVLIGDMSIVGPRPEVEKWITVYPEKWKLILSVKPGLTDNASIVFRREEYSAC